MFNPVKNYPIFSSNFDYGMFILEENCTEEIYHECLKCNRCQLSFNVRQEIKGLPFKIEIKYCNLGARKNGALYLSERCKHVIHIFFLYFMAGEHNSCYPPLSLDTLLNF